MDPSGTHAGLGVDPDAASVMGIRMGGGGHETVESWGGVGGWEVAGGESLGNRLLWPPFLFNIVSNIVPIPFYLKGCRYPFI